MAEAGERRKRERARRMRAADLDGDELEELAEYRDAQAGGNARIAAPVLHDAFSADSDDLLGDNVGGRRGRRRHGYDRTRYAPDSTASVFGPQNPQSWYDLNFSKGVYSGHSYANHPLYKMFMERPGVGPDQQKRNQSCFSSLGQARVSILRARKLAQRKAGGGGWG